MIKPYVVALEGPSGAGKTTLTGSLLQAFEQDVVVVLPDYSKAAGGGDRLPRAPAESVEEELLALQFLLNLDKERWRRGTSVDQPPSLVIMDRSVHTLLAHRYAVSHMTGLKAFGVSCRSASEHREVVWPDLILYLDTPQSILTTRITKPVPMAVQIFVDPRYNMFFREYFLPTLQYTETLVVVLDGSQSFSEILATAVDHIRQV
ncbi:MAG: hypothetical protein AAB737_01815 [Patescibacteria group bacterium]